MRVTGLGIFAPLKGPNQIPLTHLRYVCITNYMGTFATPSVILKKVDGYRTSRQGPKFVSVKEKKVSLVIVISRVITVTPRLTPVMIPVFVW